MTKQKRTLAVHDISCFGKCSLTVALPILSAAGVETAILPTSILSTHTGGFGTPVFHDLTEEISTIIAHWKSFGLTFDALYTGYLASQEQIEGMLVLFNDFGAGSLKLVDPVMGDNGALYRRFSSDFPQKMAELCKYADVITPNLTEAALLLGIPYVEGPYKRDYVEYLLWQLAERFDSNVVLTGVYWDDAQVGAAVLQRARGEVSFAFAPRIEGHFHGTGDIFSSVLLAALLADKPLSESVDIAVHVTAESIRLSDLNRPSKYGVGFERALPMLMKRLNLI